MQEYYKILGITENASDDELETAYKKLTEKSKKESKDKKEKKKDNQKNNEE